MLWGTFNSGGHVIAAAADDPLIAGVISQGAAMDGLAAVVNIWSCAGPRQLLRLTAHGVLDLVVMLLNRRPHYVQLAGEPDSAGAMTADDSLSGYAAIWGPSFVNQMAARGFFVYPFNRPRAKRLRMPVHLTIANHDSIAPTSGMEKVAKRVGGPVRVERMDVGHFDIYLGNAFEQVVKSQTEFLRSLLRRPESR